MKFLWFGGVLFGLLCSMMSCMTVWTVYDAEEQEPLFYSGVRRSVDIMGSGNSGVLGMVMSGGNPAGLFYAQVLAVVDFPLSAVADTVLLPYTIPQSVVVHSQIKAEKERVELFQRVKEGSFSSSEFQSFYEASKKNETIRDGLLENPKTPSEILEQIYEEQGKEIKVCIQMACHPQSSSRLLERIDPELDGSLPKLLAKHPQSSSKLLAGLAQKYDQDIELQRYIAFHRETSEETLSQFLKKYYDPQQEEYPYDVDLVLESIAAHRNATEEMRFLFFQNPAFHPALASSPHLSSERIEVLLGSSNYLVRIFLAQNATLPEKFLWRLAEDPSAVIREKLAEQSYLPQGVLERLRRDPEESVRSVALKNPMFRVP